MILNEIVNPVPFDVMKGFLAHRPEVSICVQTSWHVSLPALMHPLRTVLDLLCSHLDLILSLGTVAHLHQPQPHVCAGTDLESVRHLIIPLLPAGNARLLAFGAQVSGLFTQLRGVGPVYVGA
jgi:hypothetical protein